jgi:hypothetical protein
VKCVRRFDFLESHYHQLPDNRPLLPEASLFHKITTEMTISMVTSMNTNSNPVVTPTATTRGGVASTSETWPDTEVKNMLVLVPVCGKNKSHSTVVVR